MKRLLLNLFAPILCLITAALSCLIVPGIPMFIILVILALCNVRPAVSDNVTAAFLLTWLITAFALWIYLCTLAAKLIGVYLRGHALQPVLDNDRLLRFLRWVSRRKNNQVLRPAEPLQMPDTGTHDATIDTPPAPAPAVANRQTGNDRATKMKQVYLPVLLSTIAFVAAYNLLFWVLAIKWHVLDTMANLTEFGLPLGLAVVPVLVWHRQRLHILNLEAKAGDRRTGYMLLVWAVVACTNMFTQYAVEKANRGLVRLDNISGIDSAKPVQCYTIKNCYIGKNNDCIYHASYTDHDDLTLLAYVVYPVFSSPADTDLDKVAAWIGTKFIKPLGDDLTSEQKNAARDSFEQECLGKARDTDISKFVYLEKPTDRDNYDCYMQAVQECSPGRKGIILLPVNEPFEDDDGTFYTVLAFFVLAGGALLWLPMFLLPPINHEELDLFLKGEQKHSLRQVFRFFIPKKGYFATPIILDINIAIYLIMVAKGPEYALLGFGRKYLISWGANYTPLTLHGQWWRLLTCTFLHSGLMHVANNIVALMFIGMFFEKALGAKKFFMLYIITGIAGSAASTWWHANAVSVGASGAVMGIYGVYFALLFTNILPKVFFKRFFRVLSIVIVAGTLLIGLAPGIDDAAHLGGLVSGFILGFMIRPFMEPLSDIDIEELTDVLTGK